MEGANTHIDDNGYDSSEEEEKNELEDEREIQFYLQMTALYDYQRITYFFRAPSDHNYLLRLSDFCNMVNQTGWVRFYVERFDKNGFEFLKRQNPQNFNILFCDDRLSKSLTIGALTKIMNCLTCRTMYSAFQRVGEDTNYLLCRCDEENKKREEEEEEYEYESGDEYSDYELHF